jgi:ATP-binding cassette subfamily G (WHITE) protein 2 (PDR)
MLTICCSIIMPLSGLPTFWTFAYRVSPLTYLVSGMLSAGLSHNHITCSDLELLRFEAPSNMSCAEYLAPYMSQAGGQLVEGGGDLCQYCPLATTDAYLDTVEIFYDDRWRNFGLQFAYIAFNIIAALGIYWLARVPKNGGLFKSRK